MIEIDGSHGEGGGQIIRSSLALMLVTGKPFRVYNVRAGRAKPGLKRQHVTAVKAAREICGAGVTGAELQSSELIFAPGPIQTRDFHFKIGTAGSSTLVAQTVLPALMQAAEPSTITIEGGTHNQGAPPYDFLERVYLPQIEKFGPKFKIKIESYGFFPVGGGKFKIEITPSNQLGSLNLLSRKHKTSTTITSLVSQLPLHIAEREIDIVRRKGKWRPNQCRAIEIKNSPGPGNVLMIEFDSGNVRELITGFGQRGVKAEDVARQTYRESKPYIDSNVPVGEHLADQLLLPMGLAASQGQSSSYVSGPLSLHSKTHIEILKMFLEIEIRIEEIETDTFQVTTGSASP